MIGWFNVVGEDVTKIKNAILGPLLCHWQTDGFGDIPDDIIFKELNHCVPDLSLRIGLEKRQVSERGCLSLLNDKKLETERKLATDKAEEKIACANARALREDKAQKNKEEKKKKEDLAKAKMELLPLAKQIEMQERKKASQVKRMENALRKKEEKYKL